MMNCVSPRRITIILNFSVHGEVKTNPNSAFRIPN